MSLYKVSKDNITDFFPPLASGDILEKKLEDILVETKLKPLFNRELLIIGRQIPTSSGKFLDILAIDENGQLIIVELKRGQAPRDVIAQILDYASWLKSIPERELEGIFKKNNNSRSFTAEYRNHFQKELGNFGDQIRLFLFAKVFSEELKNKTNKLAISYERGKELSVERIEFDIYSDKNDGIFLHIKREDEKDIYEPKKPTFRKSLPTQKADLDYFFKLGHTLENRYGEWARGFKGKIHKLFSPDQYDEGDGTYLYTEWILSNYRVGLYIGRTRSLKEYSCIDLTIEKKKNRPILLSILENDSIKALVAKNNYKVENEHGHENLPYLRCFVSREPLGPEDAKSEEMTTEQIISELEKAMPVIEAILRWQRT